MKQEELTGVCVCVCKGRSHILFFTFVSFDITRVCTADGRKKGERHRKFGKEANKFVSVCVCEGIWKTERNKPPADLRHGAFNNHPFSIPFAKN